MIKINLLGKKKASAQVPFQLDERLAKLGVSTDQIMELRPQLVKLALLLVGVYAAGEIPAQIMAEKVRKLDQQIEQLGKTAQGLEKELASKKDLRRQMEDLNKGELELQRQLNAIVSLQKDRGLAFRTVDSLVNLLPGKVWVNEMSFNHRQMRITGSCWEYFPINDFVKSVSESSQFKDVIFRGIQTEPSKMKVPGIAEHMQRIKNFEMEFTVKGAEDT